MGGLTGSKNENKGKFGAEKETISSKKSRCELKKKDNLGAKSSTSSPDSIQWFTYSNPFDNVNANSCIAVEPASLMWYPLIETVL